MEFKREQYFVAADNLTCTSVPQSSAQCEVPVNTRKGILQEQASSTAFMSSSAEFNGLREPGVEHVMRYGKPQGHVVCI